MISFNKLVIYGASVPFTLKCLHCIVTLKYVTINTITYNKCHAHLIVTCSDSHCGLNMCSPLNMTALSTGTVAPFLWIVSARTDGTVQYFTALVKVKLLNKL